MKYKTFRALVWTGVAVLVGFGGWRCFVYQRAVAEEHQADYQRRVAQAAADNAARLEDVERRRREAEAQDVGVAVADAGPQPAASGVPALVGAVGAQTPEAYLLATLGGAAREDKLKDVTGGQGAKINVYNEGGVWARAKVDHDRDEKWDEKWTIAADGAIQREVAPADDEQYSETYVLTDKQWVRR